MTVGRADIELTVDQEDDRPCGRHARKATGRRFGLGQTVEWLQKAVGLPRLCPRHDAVQVLAGQTALSGSSPGLPPKQGTVAPLQNVCAHSNRHNAAQTALHSAHSRPLERLVPVKSSDSPKVPAARKLP